MQDIIVRIRRHLFNGLICKIWRMIMIYELATIEELHAVYDLVQYTIKKVYPKYYPAEVVVFFCELHSKEAIKRISKMVM